MILAVFVVIGALRATPAVRPQPPQACLHEAPTETQEQHARRILAVQLTRLVNSAEASFAAHSATQAYGTLDQLIAQKEMKPLPPSGQYVNGFDLHLDVTDNGYWFEFVDRTDPCGFRFISNHAGIIFTAEPIR
jgi:hypothetical protein